ncbi:unnamed protein product, partial [Didymodactylos carnosus]
SPLSEKDINQLKHSIGKNIATNGYLSTSLCRIIAEKFTANVLFKIKIDTSLKNIVYAYVSTQSAIPDEEEVLFDLGALFQIQNVEQEEENKWIVTMITINNTEYLHDDDFVSELDRLQINTTGLNIKCELVFGRFLTELCKYDKAIEYLEKLLQRTILKDYDKYSIFITIAEAYFLKKDFDDALLYAMECLDLYSHYLMSISDDLVLVANIYLMRMEYDLAIEFYENVLKITSIDNISKIAELHWYIGYIYDKKQNYLYALKHCQQSIEILNEFESSTNFNRSKMYPMKGVHLADKTFGFFYRIDALETIITTLNNHLRHSRFQPQ